MKLRALALALACAWGALACSNVMLPADPATVWVYSRTEGDRTDTYAVRRMADGDGNVTEESAAPDAPATQRYRCQAGAMLPEQLDLQVPGLSAEVQAASGTALPAEADWRVGGHWQYHLDLQASAQGTLRLAGPATLDVSYRVLDQGPLTVAAGQFNAFRVEVTRTLSGRLGSVPYRRVLRATEWYAPGVGLVRREAAGVSAELLDRQSE